MLVIYQVPLNRPASIMHGRVSERIPVLDACKMGVMNITSCQLAKHLELSTKGDAPHGRAPWNKKDCDPSAFI